MSSEMITIPTNDGSFSAYCAKPASGSGPVIVVLQEIFGINPFLKSIADGYADEGYVAIVPDLFWRLEPGLSLDPTVEEEWQKALSLYQKFDVKTGVEDIKSAVAFARDHAAGTGKVGAVGFCLGGLLAYLTAAHTDCDASVGYYGVGIQDHLDDADGVKNALMLHFGDQDGFVPDEARKTIEGAIGGRGNVDIFTYEGCDHGFARVDDERHYDAAATATAHERTASFFNAHLKA